MHVQSNIANNNNHRAYMSKNYLTPLATTSYIHLCPYVNRKPNLSGGKQCKNAHPYRKFQTGSTTTFSGYTNISNYNKNNDNNYVQRKQQNYNITHLKSSNYNRMTKLSSNTNHIPSLMYIDLFQQPSRRNRHTFQHAQQYRDQATLYQRQMDECYEKKNNNDNMMNYRTT